MVALLLVGFSGCADDEPPSETSSTATASASISTSATAPTTTDPPVDAPLPNEVVLTNCTGWRIVHNSPGTTAPGEPPAGWEASDPATLISGVEVQGARCERVAMGTFERGPRHFVFEFHSNGQFPPACQETADRNAMYGILQSVWVDDPELVGFLRAAYGIPAFLVQAVQEDEALADGVAQHTVSWGPSGQPSSTLTFIDDDQDLSGSLLPQRLAWTAGAGVGLLDFLTEMEGPFFESRTAHGTFEPPMLLATVADGNYAGYGAWFPGYRAQLPIQTFRDPACEEPA